MKKITLLSLLITLTCVSYGQTYDFTNSDDGWNSLTLFTAATNATYYTLTTVDGDGAKKNPAFGNLTAGANADTNPILAITLKNGSSSGPTYLRVSYPKTTSGRFYSNLDITNGDTEFKTYYFDLAGTDGWAGTVDDIKIHFKNAGNTDYILPDNPNNAIIDIDKIELLASIPTTLRETYTFDTTDDTEGFVAVNGSISGPSGGILTFTPTTDKYAKLDQTLHYINADNSKYVRITLKNNSAKNDQLRLVSPGLAGTLTQQITVSDTSEKTYYFDLTSEAGWTGNQTFTVGIGSYLGADGIADSGDEGKAADDGTMEFGSIIFNNVVLAVNKNELANFAIYPNPTRNRINIQGLTDISKVEIYSILGKKLLDEKSLINNMIDLSGLNNGIYLISVMDTNNRSITKKIIVQR